MLFPKNVRRMLATEHGRFIACYEQMLDKQKSIMFERGKDRDNESPIYFRRSPEMNLGVAQSKIHRIEATNVNGAEFLIKVFRISNPRVIKLFSVTKTFNFYNGRTTINYQIFATINERHS